MRPPWREHPAVPLGSIGWRMGAGEDYWLAVDAWFAGQDAEARRRNAENNPEPPGWTGFYARKRMTPVQG